MVVTTLNYIKPSYCFDTGFVKLNLDSIDPNASKKIRASIRNSKGASAGAKRATFTKAQVPAKLKDECKTIKKLRRWIIKKLTKKMKMRNKQHLDYNDRPEWFVVAQHQSLLIAYIRGKIRYEGFQHKFPLPGSLQRWKYSW